MNKDELKNEDRFLYIGPDMNCPYYGEGFNAQYVGNALKRGIPLKHFVELEGEELETFYKLYDDFHELFGLRAEELRKENKDLCPKESKKIFEKVGLKDFVDNIAARYK